MSNSIFKVPTPKNEPVLSYAPGTYEKNKLKETLQLLQNNPIDIPMYIGSEEVFTGEKKRIHPPHDKNITLGYYYEGNSHHVTMAIEAALEAKAKWENTPWQERAAIFLKAAELIAGPYRAKMNAATMLAQSKNAFQSEIDAVCEMVDFFRFNVQYMTDIYGIQPDSDRQIWNRMEYRPLEGFVFALTPFNFTSIAANLCAAPAMMGNTVVWKPAETQIYSAQVIMEVYKEAGLPDGVINLIYVDGPTAGEVIFSHPEFSGLHFTGSTSVFQKLWQTIGKNITHYKSYPRIVGETGGKDFVLAHASADAKALATALVRGAFEFQGQKCSAASRAYIPQSLWPSVLDYISKDLASMQVGTPLNFTNFVNAVIDQRAFNKIKNYIENAKKSDRAEVILGGGCDDSIGYFIQPTVIKVSDPHYTTMCEEIFGPVLSIYVFEDNDYEKVLDLVDTSSPYALTGALFARDRYIIHSTSEKLKHSAGNYYINDKPTGAVVGQQPFGGGRGSGTNDKAGSVLNLFRWVSARTIKENFVPPHDYRYPFMDEE